MRRTRSTPSISSSALVGPEVTCLALCRRSHVHDGMQCEDTMLRCSLIRQLQGMPQYLIVQQASGSDVHTVQAMQVEASVAMPWYFFQSQDAPNSSIPMLWPFPWCATCGVWCGVHRWCAHIWSGVWCGVVWCGVVWCAWPDPVVAIFSQLSAGHTGIALPCFPACVHRHPYTL